MAWQGVAKLVRLSGETYHKLQKAQRVRESYGDVVDRAIDALLEKEGQ
jgi:predicted CopG family antitoxin